MSYCIAWKKNNYIFMLSESALSSLVDEIQLDTSTFGEVQGLYGKYYVQEGMLKILKINDDFVLGVAGDVSIIEELLGHLYNVKDMLTLEMIRKILTTNYKGKELSAIIVQRGTYPQIFSFQRDVFSSEEKCEIGIGKEDIRFSQNIQNIIDIMDKNYEAGNEHDYLAKVIGFAQCYSIKRGCLKDGYGGTFYGILVHNKICWFRDIGYYIFEKNIQEGIFASVINRRNSVFSTSNASNATLFMLNNFLDREAWTDLYFKRAIIKSLHTKNPFYFFIYSKFYHVAIYMRMNSESQNYFVKRWLKRNDDDVECAFAFRPELLELCLRHKNETSELPVLKELPIPTVAEKYVPHELIGALCDVPDWLSDNIHKQMDFDFSAYVISGCDSDRIVPIKKMISQYHNLVLVDFHYFCTVCTEIYQRYHSLWDIDINKLDLSSLVSKFLARIAENDFNQYLFVFEKEANRDEYLDGIDMSNVLITYKNVKFVEGLEPSTNFEKILFLLLKNYYLNDNFFHLDKFIIAGDSAELNRLLLTVIPEFNLSNQNPDIVLIRNMNGMTAMDGRFRYTVIDYWIIASFGIPFEKIGELDTILDIENNHEPSEG